MRIKLRCASRNPAGGALPLAWRVPGRTVRITLKTAKKSRMTVLQTISTAVLNDFCWCRLMVNVAPYQAFSAVHVDEIDLPPAKP